MGLFDNAETVIIHGKEVESIITSDGGVIYQKPTTSEDLILEFTGSQFSISSMSEGLTGGNIVIDWGDGTTTNYSSVSDLNHTYNESGDYTITIKRVTSLGRYCFMSCAGVTSIVIPDTITTLSNFSISSIDTLSSVSIPDSVNSIGYRCFNFCRGLSSINIPDSVTSIDFECFGQCSILDSVVLNWDNPNEIITYDSSWISGANSNLKFVIPEDTLQYYINKGYPVGRLVEVDGTSILSVSSSAGVVESGSTLTLTALLSDGVNVYSNESVSFQIYHESTLVDTLIGITDSNGEANVTYTGSGLGELVICAVYGSLVSENHPVKDYAFYDSCTDSPLNSKWYNANGFSSITIDETGALLTNDSENAQYLLACDPTGNSSNWNDTMDWDNNYECKFEIVSYSGSCYYMKDDETIGRRYINSTGEVTVRPSSSTKVQLGFRVNSGGELKIKNFRIYQV